jgi:hypothetical protein
MKNSTTAITATLAEPALLKNLVEKLAYRRNNSAYCFEKVQAGWNAIVSSSIEAYVSGDIILSEETDFTIMPFDTSFVFTCIKSKDNEYNLTWTSSLS